MRKSSSSLLMASARTSRSVRSAKVFSGMAELPATITRLEFF